jgi:hypothetical protein
VNSKPRSWSQKEVDALVADYFAMLVAEQRGEKVNKAARRRALIPLLNGRSERAIEDKHQNVSAILIELDCPNIAGYQPLVNYQALLFDTVSRRLREDAKLAATLSVVVVAGATRPTVADLLSRWEEPPAPTGLRSYQELHERAIRSRAPVNWFAREANNRSLGKAGEEFVLEFERARLARAGQQRLAERVEHVALQDESAGFDIRSFESDGSDRLIEVKTTGNSKHIPFFVSRNEVNVSRRKAAVYHLYRVFRFRDNPRLYGLMGALDDTCLLDPVQYSARVK